MSSWARPTLALIGACSLVGSAQAQLLPGVPISVNLPPIINAPVTAPVVQDVLGHPQTRQAIRPTLDTVAGLPVSIAEAGAPTLLELRRLRLRELIRDHRSQLEADDHGNPVRRGVLVAVNPNSLSLQLASAAGFVVMDSRFETQLGLRTVVLAIPPGKDAKSAIRLLSKIAPTLQADFDHVYEPAGSALLPISGVLASSSVTAQGAVVGMIDGGVASSPVLSGASIEQSGFAGAPKPTGHGTAVASLLVGNQGSFRGAAVGARLYVADVYGGSRAAGSATVIVRALDWLASKRPRVINISIVGPPNKLVERAIVAVRSRGIHVVAAVGNDGPAAPPQYPASFPGVLAITATDARGRALPEAGRAQHLDFAAPGADMAAALPGQGFARVRGTSFAAPLAAARLVIAGSPDRLAAEASPGKGRVGRGIVCSDCRTDPKAVRAK